MTHTARPLISVIILATILAAVPGRAQDPATAPPDTAANVEDLLENLAFGEADSLAQAGDDTTAVEAADRPLINSWTHNPVFKVDADVRRVGYEGSWNENVTMYGGQQFTVGATGGREEYRRQDKTIQRLRGNASWSTGTILPFLMTVSANYDRNEDRTVNTGGRENLNLRENRSGNVRLTKRDIALVFGSHDIVLSSRLLDRTGENQGQRDEASEKKGDGALRSGFRLIEGVTLATRIYGTLGEGTKRLGTESSPAYDRGDTLGAGVYYDRRMLSGQIVITRSNFASEYLDFRRNENGLVDTLNLDPGVPRIVDETETKDGITLEWDNKLRLGSLGFESDLSRTTGQTDFEASLVGLRESLAEQANLKLTFGAGRDSFAIGYRYLWKWDDQLYGNATERRGKKYDHSRDFDLAWYRDLFANTDLTVKLHQGLSQTTAENQFDNNDRDRFDEDFSIDMKTNWANTFRTTMAFQYKQTQDVSIRASRSANNNTKDSYEIAPGYVWPLATWITMSQNFRMYIEYTDYHYDNLEGVRNRDDYSKRGNLQTRLNFNPTRRFRLDITHDYTQRFNAERTRTDAAGQNFYQRTQEQAIGKIDLAFSFEAAKWISLEGATYRSRDIIETIGASGSTTERFAGQIWLGARLDQKIGGRKPLKLAGTIRKYLAYGPNVTETSRDYWEANLTMDWRF